MQNQITFGNGTKIAKKCVHSYANLPNKGMQNIEGHLTRSSISLKEIIVGIGSFFASIGAYLGLTKKEKTAPKLILPNQSDVYQEDVKQIKTLQNELDYGFALMRGEHDSSISEIYLRKCDELYKDKKTIVSRMVDKVLNNNPKYNDLSEDYSDEIKHVASSKFLQKDYSFNGEESIDKIIEEIEQRKTEEAVKQKEAEAAERIKLMQTIAEDEKRRLSIYNTMLALGYSDPQITNMSAREVIDSIKAKKAILNQETEYIEQLYKDVSAGKINVQEAFDKILDELKNISAECLPNEEADSGINDLIG